MLKIKKRDKNVHYMSMTAERCTSGVSVRLTGKDVK